ncbi:MAG: DegT/DnrJ/EryC1/StrS family aminotransferase [Helicobacteraceae bacterium]|jgi:dTDP-4-amino-4,6-dideoxygalactose transaminase|nr:DegT/DnrJ/EryC1/StrS family aminotransferase [Helicobacteraceae bacterium]
MANKRIFLSPPHMGGDELNFIREAFDKNYVAPLGENVTGFEKDLKTFTGAKYALGVSSGTAALHLALRVLGVGAGDLVAVSDFTFIGSVSPIIFQNAEPIFIDGEEKSWNLDPNLLEELCKKRAPKALVLVHLYGQSADMDAICEICERYGVTLIEDAAEALGASWRGAYCGAIARFGVYSFNGNKIITTSGGGALVASEEAPIKKALFFATQARENAPHYEHREIGYNYRMSNIVAGIGRGQMRVLADRVKRKREIFEFYRRALSDLPIEFMPELAPARGNRWLSTITIEDKDVTPERLRLALEKENIESRPLWKPMHLQPVFKEARKLLNGVSQKLFDKGLCLPSGTAMSEDDLALIAATIRRAFS